jgi:hypothetical protein
MGNLYLKIMWFLQRFYWTSLLQMWVSWDECILLGTYKIMLMILISHICLLAILLHINSSIISYVQYWWNCNVSSFFWYPLLWYLLLFSKHLNYLLSLVDSCDVFDVFWGWSSSTYNKINLSLWPCFKAKILLVFCMTSFEISCSMC